MKQLFMFFVMLTLCSGSLLANDKVYTFGIVPQFDARHIQKVWRPILDDIERRTGYKFRIIGSPTIPAFEDQFFEGKFDFAYMNPYHALQAAESKKYDPIVRDVARMLYGIIVVRSDSNITTIKELEGKTVVFPAPNALGASLIPRAEFSRDFKITIKPKYVQSHSSVYLNVALGRAVAGGGVQKTLSQQKPQILDKLKVIHKTQKFPPHPIVVHRRIDEQVKSEVTKALLAMGKAKGGKELLSQIPMKKIGPTTINDYLPIKKYGLEEFYLK